MTTHQRSILAVAMVTQGVAVGMTMGMLPVLLEPLETAFEAPRTVIAAGQILMMLALTAGSLVTGAALDRGHARGVMLAGAGLMISAQLLASVAPNLVVLGLAALMAGAAVPPLGPITAASLVTRTFDAERGRALGLASMGPPLGSGAIAMLAGWALLQLPWRQVYVLFAVLAAVVLLPAIWSVVPSRYETAPAASPAPDTDAVSMLDVLKRPAFLWAGALFALATGIVTGWTVHVVAYLGGAGFEETDASRLFAVQNWMGVPGAILFGTLSDRLPLTALLVGMLGAVGACLLGLATEPGLGSVTALCIVAGFAFGGMVPLYMVLIGRRMGPDAMGRAMGLSNLLMLPVMAASVLFAASIFESTAGYASALVVFAVGLTLAIGCALGSSRNARNADLVGRPGREQAAEVAGAGIEEAADA